MLIRSQNKKIIINLDNISDIRVCDMSIFGETSTFDINVDVGTIGTYSTKEKAIKVLDMIQEKYTEYVKVADGWEQNVQGLYVLPTVFKMPQDSEM